MTSIQTPAQVGSNTVVVSIHFSLFQTVFPNRSLISADLIQRLHTASVARDTLAIEAGLT